jgi:hypothetical protein
MNRRAILFNLREAAEELNRTIQELETDSKYNQEDFQVAMGHLYHHLNTAWNGRNQTHKQFKEADNFDKFQQFPKASEFYWGE